MSKTFVVHVTALEPSPRLAKMLMHFSQVAQIAALKQEKALIKVLSKYANYADVFRFNLAIELPENTGINKQIIKLENGQQPPYGLIYSLRMVNLETLKTYIKAHLKSEFI